MGEDDKLIRTAITAVAGVAVAVGAYILVKKLYASRSKLGPGVKIADVTADQMLDLLKEVQDSHDAMKKMMVELKKVIASTDLSFEQICAVVDEMKPVDPLNRYGISLEEFSQLLAQFSGNEKVRKNILKLTAGPYQTDGDKSTLDPVKVRQLTDKYSVEDVIAMHSYMLGQLRKVSDGVTFREPIHPRVATIAAQAYIGAQLQEHWQVSSDDLEALTSLLHTQLAEREEFFEVGAEMRHVVALLVEKCSSVSNEPGTKAGG